MIDNAKSGHPGICLGAATILYTLFSRHLSFNRNDSKWYNRDRFVLSAGHGAPLLYSMMYMLGILNVDDVKNLRQLDSITPGHPEITTPFVDMSTGPLGQGIASSVGMAIAERYLNSTYNKDLINHYTYVLCGDGDLEEGISYEAMALASKLKLNKLIILYDSNNITLDGKLSMSSTEDVITRFKALNFNILVVDGESIKEIDYAITRAKESPMPTIIICKTTIGKYSKDEGTNTVHGKPLSKEDIKNIKETLDMYESPFTLSNDSVEYLKNIIDKRMYLVLRDYERKYEDLKENEKNKLDKLFSLDTTYNLGNIEFEYEDLSLRDISSNILNGISQEFPLLIGGSADLSSSCKTRLKQEKDFDSENYSGRNINFGIREHAMGAIINGMALSGLRSFGSTFLVFSDYLRGAIRMSAIMNLPVIYIFTHDSITVGEDGITHEPIEQLASLELIPNLYIYRPYDVNELLASYRDILKNNHPSVLVLPRDNKEISELTRNNRIEDGAYILKKEETNNFITLIGNGEELGLIIKVSERLNAEGFDTRIVSVPCMQNALDKDINIIPSKKSIAITFGVSDYYYKFTKNVIGINTFGKSAKKSDILDYFGFTEDKLINKIKDIVGEKHE
jgi:transketolase